MIRYLTLLPFSLLMTIINYTCAPVIALFCRRDWTLPRWLAWFATTDALMNGKGIRPGGGGGDVAFYTRNLSRPQWLVCTLWLWRNPINGFDEGPCGARYTNDWRYVGNHDMEQSFSGRRMLWRLKHYGASSLLFRPFELYAKIRWSKTRYFRLRVGWKLDGTANPAQYVCVPSPFKRVY